MQTIRVREKADKDGTLLLRIPLGKPEADYEVVVIVQPSGAVEQGRGWPTGYFEKSYGSIDDESFFRQPQGDLPKPVELD